jgi:RNA polymerase sigma-70 factor (ECF subfamily)
MNETQGKVLEERMRLALAGDKRAYASALEETAMLLRPYLARRLRQGSDLEDLVQEILISIHKARHTYDCERPYKPWALAIARFRLNDYLRKHYADKLHGASELEDAEGLDMQDVTKAGLSYESIKGEVEQLPGKQAMILQLMHEEGYTAREVAEKIGMKESAVKVAAHRAYKVLKKKLENE